MLIGVLSDTHDRLPQIDAAVELFTERGVEVLLHPGDFIAPFAVQRLKRFAGPIHAVFGNNDGERRMLKEVLPQVQMGPQLIELDGRRILLHHFVYWCPAELIAQADIIVTGHTHEPVNHFEPAGESFDSLPRAAGFSPRGYPGFDPVSVSAEPPSENGICSNRVESAGRVNGGKLFLNPGECCGWISDRSTVALLDTDGPRAEIMELEIR